MKKTTCSCGRINPMGSTCKCKREKRSEYMKNYDRDPLLSTRKWLRKRLSIIKRDKGLCQRCLALYGEYNGKELQVHHIKSRKDYPELTFDDNNLITVCKMCNLKLGTKNVLDFEKREIDTTEYSL